ncbi:MAG: nucleolar complex protein 14 [Cirrosporium novae-zelandiae]|nr:MAG: nucleolar complex protein 14 [Cirrosporium novae-zelandiae]
MAPSQLKQLKASLRDKGIVGPQKSKKQRKQNVKNGKAAEQQRLRRSEALQSIREQFNPFEVKAPARPAKFEVAKIQGNGRAGPGVQGRPGVTRSLGEERRRQTLLVEMQQRKKAGLFTDRRFGEDDPTMTPEEKAAERFAREKQKHLNKGSMFNLEDDEEDGLTHMGRELTFGDDKGLDDFDEDDLSGGEQSDGSSNGGFKKRKRELQDVEHNGGEQEGEDDDAEEPLRKKTKAEVMKEVIAKSKLYKYERQKAKEDDEDLRAELDKGLPDIFKLLQGHQPPPKVTTQEKEKTEPTINADRAALINGKDRAEADKEYDERLRQLVYDKRSQPTDRTKTEEEQIENEAKRLKDLEEKRLRRMAGEPTSSDDEGDEVPEDHEEELQDDAQGFGLGSGIQANQPKRELDVEDEDDFILDDGLIESDSEADLASSGEDEDQSASDNDDTEFVQGLLSKDEERRPEFRSNVIETTAKQESMTSDKLAYTYPCPQSQEELLQVREGTSINDLPTIIQRIRALHHPKLKAENKAKMGVFSAVLVDHLSYLANQEDRPPFNPLEQLIRHIHSLAKSFPIEIANAFRKNIQNFGEQRPLKPLPGDLLILTTVGSIFPTSDHFHQVVTPAALLISRYLGQSIPQSLSDLATGAYLGSLALKYQRLSKRYIPELVNYTLNALEGLIPNKCPVAIGNIPYHELPAALRITSKSKVVRKINFWNTVDQNELSKKENDQLQLSLLQTFLSVLENMAELWADKSAFSEVFEPFTTLLRHISSKSCRKLFPVEINDQIQLLSDKLSGLLNQARKARRPLLLHNHRPLAIKTFIPKFEESYNPDKHYDPDRERAERNKLKAEHKKEKKGAMRELRKDANFMARESLREKKEKDMEYEKKYKRLIAEIQGEEGHEAKEYEREKSLRKGRR